MQCKVIAVANQKGGVGKLLRHLISVSVLQEWANDYVIIDCMPSLGMITINALAAADSVIIPVQSHYLPLKGMTQLTKTIGKVRNSDLWTAV